MSAAIFCISTVFAPSCLCKCLLSLMRCVKIPVVLSFGHIFLSKTLGSALDIDSFE